jgi:hypothetical protein
MHTYIPTYRLEPLGHTDEGLRVSHVRRKIHAFLMRRIHFI